MTARFDVVFTLPYLTPTETTKTATRRPGLAQREIAIARSRGISLHYNHITQDHLFDGDLTARPDKPELVRELEKPLQISDNRFSKNTSYQTAVAMDFMAEVRKYHTKE